MARESASSGDKTVATRVVSISRGPIEGYVDGKRLAERGLLGAFAADVNVFFFEGYILAWYIVAWYIFATYILVR